MAHYIGHNHKGGNYTGLNYTGLTYTGLNYTGLNCTGHNYVSGTNVWKQSRQFGTVEERLSVPRWLARAGSATKLVGSAVMVFIDLCVHGLFAASARA